MSFGGGGSSGASGTGLGNSVYKPTGQPSTDLQMQQVMNALFSAGNGQQGTGDNPPATYYPKAQSILSNYLDPSVAGSYANYYSGQALTAAGDAYSNYSGAGGPYGYLSQSYGPLSDFAQGGLTAAKSLPGYQSQIYGTAFDPQRTLYNSGQQAAGDYANVANAQSGVSGTPYAANVTANALTNYDTSYRAGQLKNESLGAYGGQALGSTYGGYGTSAGNAYSDIGNLGYGSNYALGSLGYAPYTATSNIGANTLAGYSNVSNLGLNAYQIPEAYIKAAESDLGLGQSASSLGSQVGNTNFNQTASTVGGALSGANALFGTNSLLGGSSGIFGSGGIGSLFGSGAAATDVGTTAASGFGSGFLGDLGAAAPAAAIGS